MSHVGHGVRVCEFGKDHGRCRCIDGSRAVVRVVCDVPKEHDSTRQLSDAQRLEAMGIDAAKWAAEFMQVQQDARSGRLDEGAMIGWFANALEAGRSAGRKEACSHKDGFFPVGDAIICNRCGSFLPA